MCTVQASKALASWQVPASAIIEERPSIPIAAYELRQLPGIPAVEGNKWRWRGSTDSSLQQGSKTYVRDPLATGVRGPETAHAPFGVEPLCLPRMSAIKYNGRPNLRCAAESVVYRAGFFCVLASAGRSDELPVVQM